MRVQVGFAATDVTPPPGLILGGYAARQSPATGVLDRLACRAAVLSDGDAPLVVVGLDLLCVSDAWASRVRQLVAGAVGSDPARILIAATHTHAAPAVFPSPGRLSGAGLDGYRDRLAEAVVATACRARDAAVPMTLCFGRAEVSGVAASRRDPAEVVDAGVRVIAARRRHGSCAVVVASFGCHPTVLSAANLDYSRDLFGAAEDAAGVALGAPVLMLNGAAADVSTRFTRRSQTPEEMRRLGAELGDGVARAVAGAVPLGSGAIAGSVRSVPLRPRRLPPPEDAERQLTHAASELERAQSSGRGGGALRLAFARLEGAAAQLAVSRAGGWGAVLGREPESAEVQVLRLGELRLLGVPGEVFSAAGRRLTRGAPAMLAGYANDYVGYLVPPECAAEGDYESLMAAVEPGSAASIEAALDDMAGHG